jgi:type I site-specific restriction-modification system R (restriction) subunit
VPCLHTIYVDKPMRGHGLMQAIARVNRVFRDRPGGLVVDYLGLADQLKQALATYTESGGQGKPSNAYHNRAIATQEVIEELIRLAKEMREVVNRGADLGLNDDEIAFYDALAVNASAVQVMGVDELKVIAVELVMAVRKSVTIDWTVRESARARIRVMVRRILKKHGYPPDLREEATRTVLEQAELLCADWAA